MSSAELQQSGNRLRIFRRLRPSQAKVRARNLLLAAGLASLFCLAAIIIVEPQINAQAATAASPGDNPAARRLLESARADLAEGKETNALNSLLRYLEIDPNNPEALQTAGDILIRQNKLQEAAGIYLRLLRLKPDDGKTLLQMGLIRQRLGQLYEAQATLYRALYPNVKDGDGLSPEDAQQARAALNQIYDNWDVLNSMQERGDIPAQERFHTHQIDKAQGNAPDKAAVSYALRGFARHSLHRPEEALRDFNTALDMGGLDPGLEEAVWRSKNDIEQARDHARFWDEIHKTVAELEARQDIPGLESYYGSLLNDNSARVYAAVSRAFLRVGRADYDGAESDLRLALNSNPDQQARNDIEKGLQLVVELRQEADQQAAREKAAATQAATEQAVREQAAAQTEQARQESAGGSAGAAPSGAQGMAQTRPKPAYINPYEYFDQLEPLLRQKKIPAGRKDS